MREQLGHCAAVGEKWIGSTSANGETVGLVWPRADGQARDSGSDWVAWKEFHKAASVPPVRAHDARHTAATTLLLLGADPRVVMDILGWSQASMLTRYQHVLDEMKQDVAAQVGADLWAAGPAPAPDQGVPGVVSLGVFRKRRSD
ncbi:tyrosine-type recombinase/integrase [Arthrobacter sp.]|uniref:tyrosine-type recombinase/integrase n=1 Tax=Arthrobacter sp. TaxID=1667 RepID=UPI003A93A775